MIEWVAVASSAIKAVGYDNSKHRMFIDFQDSQPVYTFCGVSERVFREFVRSGSVGRYYQQHIKGRYQC